MPVCLMRAHARLGMEHKVPVSFAIRETLAFSLAWERLWSQPPQFLFKR